MKNIHVISVSGGKDSTATLLIALDKISKERIVAIFCDTGNEHEQVYEYLDYLEIRLDLPIIRLKANFDAEIKSKRKFIANDRRTGRDKNGRKLRWSNKAKRRALAVLHPTGNPFLDLCLWKGRFPSRKAQFCTEELKRNMAASFQLELVDSGHRVISWQGIRHDESLNRANAKLFEKIAPKMYIHRPIIKWSASDVFDYCKENGVEPNPLYKQGLARVGCMPCINVRKNELNEIAARFPDHIDRIESWEIMVSKASKHGFGTLLHHQAIEGNDQQIYQSTNIKSCIEWSKTSRGGRHFDMFSSNVETDQCSSAYGLCE